MKGCELCGYVARMYCESDEAVLCWDCDGKVHGANFLVAKHERTLLCHVCQSPTPWKSSGPKLTPTVSVCENCVDRHNTKCERQEEEDNNNNNNSSSQVEDFDDTEEEDDGYGYGYDGSDVEEEEEEEEEGDNQVVPWSCCASPPPPPPPATSSCESSEGEISCRFFVGDGGNGDALKRMREISDLDSDDEIGCSSSQLASGALAKLEGTSMGSFRPLKQPRVEEDHDPEESRSTAIIDSLKRLQKEMVTDGQHASSTITGICNLSRDQRR